MKKIVLICLSLFEIGSAIPVIEGDNLKATFNDGRQSGNTNFSIYTSQGIGFRGFRYHQSDLPGNLNLLFDDSWGLVFENPFQVGSTEFLYGEIVFAGGINSILVNANLQLTTVDNKWSIIGYDDLGNIVGLVEWAQGPVPTQIATSSLLLANVGLISKVHVVTNRKFGIDGFEVTGYGPAVPEPSTQLSFIAGVIVLAILFARQRTRVNGLAKRGIKF